ncbi:MAG: replication-relaxation family protein [Acidobacteria bacterium]|nr:replication-relaxation family protein [Acidobacteriota bacterium]
MLAKLVAARWLTTRQVRRFFFSAVSVSAVQRRLRKLVRARYLCSYREHRMIEALYALGPKGEAVLEGKGLKITREQTPRKQVEHFAGINDLRAAVEQSSKPVAYFFAAWELAGLAWTDRVIPDAVFAVDDGKRKAFLAEYDRSNEPAREFAKKLQRYQEGLQGFQFDAVVVLTKTQGRIASLGRHLGRHILPRGRYLAIPLAEILDGD